MKQNFFEFFLPTTISDRRAAARAVAAGSFVSLILAASAGVATAVLLFKDGISSQKFLFCLGATSILIGVTVGTWKRLLLAAVVGLLVSVMILVWQIRSGAIATAVVLAIPLIGGFCTAIRGIIALKNLDRRAHPKATA